MALIMDAMSIKKQIVYSKRERERERKEM